MNRRITKFLILTFSISWVLWGAEALLVALTGMNAQSAVARILFIAGGFGPTIAGLLCMENGLSGLLQKFSKAKKGSITFVVLFFILEVVVLSRGATGLVPSISQANVPIASIALVFLQSTLILGGNEELGWRGVLLQDVQNEARSLVGSSVIVGVIWVFWHLPLWFIQGSSYQSMSFVLFAILGILLNMWLTAIYSLSANILCCMLIHGWTNTLIGIWDYQLTMTLLFGLAVLTILVVDCALVMIKKEKAEEAKRKALEAEEEEDSEE